MTCLYCNREIADTEICPFCGGETKKDPEMEETKIKGESTSGSSALFYNLSEEKPGRSMTKVPPTAYGRPGRRARKNKSDALPGVSQFFLIMLILAVPVVNIIVSACWAIGGGNRLRQNISLAFLVWSALLAIVFFIMIALYSEKIYYYIELIMSASGS